MRRMPYKLKTLKNYDTLKELKDIRATNPTEAKKQTKTQALKDKLKSKTRKISKWIHQEEEMSCLVQRMF